jgi:uncharacterized membrane protein YraQ (UPF0718 family)
MTFKVEKSINTILLFIYGRMEVFFFLLLGFFFASSFYYYYFLKVK